MLPTNLPSQTIQPYQFGKVNLGEKLGAGMSKALGARADAFAMKQKKAADHLKAVRGLVKIRDTEFPASHIGAHEYAVSQKAARTVRGKLSSEPVPATPAPKGRVPSRADSGLRPAVRLEATKPGPSRQLPAIGKSNHSVQFKPYF
jgi:hypothetical protein